MGTISTHNGSTVSLKHNKRDKSVVSKEEHIEENGKHENIIDRDIKQVYRELFGEAVKEYNKKQKRKDRQIKNYYSKICKDKKKHAVYELIVGVYGDDSTPEQKEEILKQYAKEFEERNPNLRVVGIFFHDDERDPETGRRTEKHLHIDYVPFYHSKKGLGVQQGISKALAEMGIEEGASIHETRQINWEKRENAYLEQLCNEQGIKVEHPQRDSKEKKRHLETDIYKLEKTKEEYEKMSNSVEIYQKGQRFDSLNEKARGQVVDILQQNKELAKLRQENKRLKEFVSLFEDFVNEYNLKDYLLKFHKNKQKTKENSNDFQK